MLWKGQSSDGGLCKGAVLFQVAWGGYAPDLVLSSPEAQSQHSDFFSEL